MKGVLKKFGFFLLFTTALMMVFDFSAGLFMSSIGCQKLLELNKKNQSCYAWPATCLACTMKVSNASVHVLDRFELMPAAHAVDSGSGP